MKTLTMGERVQITPVRPLMELDWPSYYGPDEEFWAHEWEKHGTCAEDVFPTQLDYFNTTLALHVANPVEVRSTRMFPECTALYFCAATSEWAITGTRPS